MKLLIFWFECIFTVLTSNITVIWKLAQIIYTERLMDKLGRANCRRMYLTLLHFIHSKTKYDNQHNIEKQRV